MIRKKLKRFALYEWHKNTKNNMLPICTAYFKNYLYTSRGTCPPDVAKICADTILEKVETIFNSAEHEEENGVRIIKDTNFNWNESELDTSANEIVQELKNNETLQENDFINNVGGEDKLKKHIKYALKYCLYGLWHTTDGDKDKDDKIRKENKQEEKMNELIDAPSDYDTTEQKPVRIHAKTDEERTDEQNKVAQNYKEAETFVENEISNEIKNKLYNILKEENYSNNGKTNDGVKTLLANIIIKIKKENPSITPEKLTEKIFDKINEWAKNKSLSTKVKTAIQSIFNNFKDFVINIKDNIENKLAKLGPDMSEEEQQDILEDISDKIEETAQEVLEEQSSNENEDVVEQSESEQKIQSEPDVEAKDKTKATEENQNSEANEDIYFSKLNNIINNNIKKIYSSNEYQFDITKDRLKNWLSNMDNSNIQKLELLLREPEDLSNIIKRIIEFFIKSQYGLEDSQYKKIKEVIQQTNFGNDVITNFAIELNTCFNNILEEKSKPQEKQARINVIYRRMVLASKQYK